MRKLSAAFSLLLLLPAHSLLSQAPCDTALIRAALVQSNQLLDGGQLQPAVDACVLALSSLAACTDADAVFREAIIGQAADCYHRAADEFVYRGMLNRGIDMGERSIALYRQLPENGDLLATAYLELAQTYAQNDNRKIALEQAINGLKTRQAANPLSSKIASHYDQIVGIYLGMDDLEGALAYLGDWETLRRRLGSKASLQMRVNLANNWALYYYAKNNIPQAIRILEDTLALYGEPLRAKGGIVGIAEFGLCEYYTVLGNYEKSLFYAEKNVALFELRLRQQRGQLFGRSHYAWCLAQSARAAWGLYRQTRDTAWYNLAERRSQQTEQMIFA
ncbi:MAG: hypothetical protein ABIQ93_10415, partial [Saprospiraceae bacterium]